MTEPNPIDADLEPVVVPDQADERIVIDGQPYLLRAGRRPGALLPSHDDMTAEMEWEAGAGGWTKQASDGTMYRWFGTQPLLSPRRWVLGVHSPHVEPEPKPTSTPNHRPIAGLSWADMTEEERSTAIRMGLWSLQPPAERTQAEIDAMRTFDPAELDRMRGQALSAFLATEDSQAWKDANRSKFLATAGSRAAAAEWREKREAADRSRRSALLREHEARTIAMTAPHNPFAPHRPVLSRAMPTMVRAADTADGGHTVTLQAIKSGVVDTYGSLWMPDCFDAALADRLPTLAWGHDWTEPIGRAVSFDTSPTGPVITFRLDDFGAVPRARQAYEQVRSGTIDDCSVGFSNVTRREPTEEERMRFPGVFEVILSADLDEVSLVLRGAVPGAKVLDVRSPV